MTRPFIMTLLLAMAATLRASPAIGPSYHVLTLENGCLAWLATPLQPQNGPYPAWEVNKDSRRCNLTVDGDGTLRIDMWLDILGSACPYYLELRLIQEPGGWIELETSVVNYQHSGPWHRAWSGRYRDLAAVCILYDTTLADLLTWYADKRPPTDMDHLRRYYHDTTTAVAVRAEVWAWIVELDDPAYAVRERAAAALAEHMDWLPQLRAALAREMLTAQQRMVLELLVVPPPVTAAVLAAAN